MVWSLVHGLVPSVRDDAWLVALDVFWPLSMLGMFAIGVKIAFTGRWRGLARGSTRWSPRAGRSCRSRPWASSEPTVGHVVGATHLLVGYAALGLIIAARPHLVVPRS